ncbi:unnamed protein product [Fraxinus pennsylvanica]|uniref:Uncharacterized protein n=1 Tax=Fraxinus pennsylvanica TaxID=56036 RepID=A0AAD1ZRS9_9LAMI|nr:unnamed protein product [Fraxinus pennsylvanica]
MGRRQQCWCTKANLEGSKQSGQTAYGSALEVTAGGTREESHHATTFATSTQRPLQPSEESQSLQSSSLREGATGRHYCNAATRDALSLYPLPVSRRCCIPSTELFATRRLHRALGCRYPWRYKKGLVHVLCAGSARASHEESTEEILEFDLEYAKSKGLCKVEDVVIALHQIGIASIIKIVTLK